MTSQLEGVRILGVFLEYVSSIMHAVDDLQVYVRVASVLATST